VPEPARLFLLLALLAGCGSRTELPTGSGVVRGDAGAPVDADATIHCGAPLPPVDCRAAPWVLFDFSDGATELSTIYALRSDGTGGHAVTLPHGPGYYPSVSPDGTKLLYVTAFPETSDGGDDTSLYLYDFATGCESLVVTANGLAYSALSPDGTTIAYSADYGLYAIGADGSNDRPLVVGSDTAGGYGHPAFTADSQTVVYGGLGFIGSIGTNGSDNQMLLVGVLESFLYPNMAFSPDYSEIVTGIFCSQDSPFDLLVFPWASLGSTPCASGRVLVADVVESSSFNMGASDPSWGPTGLIAYGAGSDVYLVPAGGGAPTNLTTGLTGDAGTSTASDPVWAPPCAPVP
jgi:Tol biopolymer transport system component